MCHVGNSPRCFPFMVFTPSISLEDKIAVIGVLQGNGVRKGRFKIVCLLHDIFHEKNI